MENNKPETALKRALACVSVVFLALAAAIPFSDFASEGSVFSFVPLLLLASAAYFGAAHFFQNIPASARAKLFWWVAISLRLAVLPMAAGDDLYRCFWEGRIQHLGFNPYLLAPDSPLLTPFRDADWALINHRNFAAIYPPGAELLLKWLTLAGPSVLLFKIICGLADVAIIFLLLRLNTGLRRYRDTVWYAWNPLVIYSFSGAAHFDSLMLATLLMAVYALFRANPMGKNVAHCGWAALAAFVLGISISIKLVPLVMLPVFAFALRSRMVVLPIAGIVPWLTALAYGFPENRLFDSFREFSYVARFNDFFWWISERFLWANPTQKNGVYNLIALVVALILSLIAWKNWRRALLWVLGATLLCSTVVHPWYLTWILPFATFRNARVWFVLSGTIFLAFLWWETTPWWTAWQTTPLLSLSICLPPLLYFAVAGRVSPAKITHGQR